MSTVHSRIAIPAQELFVVACDGSVADGTASGFATETQQQLPSGTHLTQTFRLTWQALAGNANAQFTGTTTFVAVRQVQQLTVTGHAQLFQNHRLYDVSRSLLHITVSPGTEKLVSLSLCTTPA